MMYFKSLEKDRLFNKWDTYLKKKIKMNLHFASYIKYILKGLQLKTK